MTYCDICNTIIINMTWYIEQTMNEIKNVVEDCMNHTPSMENKHYTFANGNIKEGENYIIDEDDWENSWSKV